MNWSSISAVALAAVAAVLFGLAALRQHGAVHEVASRRPGTGLALSAAWRLVRQPAWLCGALQATVGGALHILALALAPISLVQPIGVLAVPVTVVGTAVAARRLPHPKEVVGSVLGVAGVVGLTVLLLATPSKLFMPPSWGVLLSVVLAAVGLGLVVIRGGARWPALARCLLLSVTAAVMWGLNSILLRTIGHLIAAGDLTTQLPLFFAALAGLAAALPVGWWAVQSAYVAGSAQVVLCCLTLVDPITAVAGGNALLGDGIALSAGGWVAAFVCAFLSVAGVVLLSRRHPASASPSVASGTENNARELKAPGSG